MSASCSTNVDPASEPEIGDVQVLASTEQISLPLEAYGVSDEYRLLQQRARAHAVADCLDRFGVEFSLLDTLDEGIHHPPNALYGIWDERQAAMYGYKAPPPPEGVASSEADLPSLSPDEELLVYGSDSQSNYGGEPIPDGGCYGEADRLMSADRPASAYQEGELDLPQQLSGEAYSYMEKDSRVVDVWAQWSECMSEAGYDYADWREPNEDPQFHTEVAGEVEIATAVADVECKHAVNQLGVMYAVNVAYEERLIDENAEALSEVAAWIAESTQRYEDIVAGG